jgi:hypothetical protein
MCTPWHGGLAVYVMVFAQVALVLASCFGGCLKPEVRSACCHRTEVVCRGREELIGRGTVAAVPACRVGTYRRTRKQSWTQSSHRWSCLVLSVRPRSFARARLNRTAAKGGRVWRRLHRRWLKRTSMRSELSQTQTTLSWTHLKAQPANRSRPFPSVKEGEGVTACIATCPLTPAPTVLPVGPPSRAKGKPCAEDARFSYWKPPPPWTHNFTATKGPWQKARKSGSPSFPPRPPSNARPPDNSKGNSNKSYQVQHTNKTPSPPGSPPSTETATLSPPFHDAKGSAVPV